MAKHRQTVLKAVPAEALVVLSHGKAHLLLHIHAILSSPGLNEGPVKEVPIVCDVDAWLHLPHAKQGLKGGQTDRQRSEIVIIEIDYDELQSQVSFRIVLARMSIDVAASM